MMKNTVRILAGAFLAAGITTAAHASVTIDFTGLTYSDLASLNADLASYGVTVDAGHPGSVVYTASGVQAPTDVGAADLLFNFSSSVSTASVTFQNVGNFETPAVGLYSFDVNTTPSGALGLTATDTANGFDNGQTLTVTAAGTEALQMEDEGAFVTISSLTFTPEATPEPATFGLLGLGALALVGKRLRKA